MATNMSCITFGAFKFDSRITFVSKSFDSSPASPHAYLVPVLSRTTRSQRRPILFLSNESMVRFLLRLYAEEMEQISPLKKR